MISDLHKHLVGIAIGVRYRANFSIEDQLGKIADQILYSKDSYFNSSIFPLVYGNTNEKVLINEKTQDKLIINNSNVILEMNYGDTITPESADEIIKNFNRQIIDGVLRINKVTEIIRIGLINKYLFKMEDLASSFIDKTIGKTLEGVNDINLRFSKKLPALDSVVLKDVNDYRSVIFNVIKKADRNDLYISIDFQRYYDPFLTSSSQIEYQQFIDESNGFNSKQFLQWLNNNYGVLK